MAKHVLGLFDTQEHAHHAVQKLIDEGIDRRAVGLIAANSEGTLERSRVDHSGDVASAGALTGAASGMLLGGLVGLLIGATTVAAPPVGLVVAGPLAATLAGAGVGLASGGLLGALIGLGVSEDEAHTYAEGIRRGGVLVTVDAREIDVDRVERLLAQEGAIDIRERRTAYDEEGFGGYASEQPLYDADERAEELKRRGVATIAPPPSDARLNDGISAYENDFRSHYDSVYVTEGRSYESLRPSYRFGYELAHRYEFRDMPWDALEPHARRVWEEEHPSSAWLDHRDAVHLGWSRGHAHLVSRGASVI
jgi:uncharacterized membrane protein